VALKSKGADVFHQYHDTEIRGCTSCQLLRRGDMPGVGLQPETNGLQQKKVRSDNRATPDGRVAA
jgi:hypothetical protein